VRPACGAAIVKSGTLNVTVFGPASPATAYRKIYLFGDVDPRPHTNIVSGATRT
jgi:hypothetical protein